MEHRPWHVERASYPVSAHARDLPDLIGGDMDLFGIPKDALLWLQAVPIRRIISSGTWDNNLVEYIEPMTASGWENIHTRATDPVYYGLEAAINAGETVAPVVLSHKTGRLMWHDGWHRISIALAAGRLELMAYVYDET